MFSSIKFLISPGSDARPTTVLVAERGAPGREATTVDARRIAAPVHTWSRQHSRLAIASALGLALAGLGFWLGGRLDSMLIGFVGACLLFLVAASLYTSIRGDAARRR